MKCGIPLVFAATLLVAADQPKPDANAKDLERMQGEWAAVSMMHDGHPLPDDDAQSLFRSVKGEVYTVSLFKKVIGKGTFKIDATNKPKTIDFLPTMGPAKSQQILGLYELDGDTWKICHGLPGKERPKELASKEGSGYTLAVWEREKK